MLKCWRISLKPNHTNLSPLLSILVGVHALCWRLATFALGRTFTITLASCPLAPPFLPLNTSKVRIDTSVIIDGERVILPHNGDAHILVGQVNLIGQGVPQRPQAVLHQLLQFALPKVIEELLQVGPGSLGPSSNGHRSAVIVIGAGTSLEDVRSLVVIACYEETNSVWSLSISLSANLHLVPKISDHAGHRQGCIVAVSRAETLV